MRSGSLQTRLNYCLNGQVAVATTLDVQGLLRTTASVCSSNGALWWRLGSCIESNEIHRQLNPICVLGAGRIEAHLS